MTLLTVLAVAGLIYLMLLFLDRVTYLTAPAKQNIASVVSVIVILAVCVWTVLLFIHRA